MGDLIAVGAAGAGALAASYLQAVSPARSQLAPDIAAKNALVDAGGYRTRQFYGSAYRAEPLV